MGRDSAVRGRAASVKGGEFIDAYETSVESDNANAEIARLLKQAIRQNAYENYTDRDFHLCLLMAIDTQYATHHIDDLRAEVAAAAEEAQQRAINLAKGLAEVGSYRLEFLDKSMREVPEDIREAVDQQYKEQALKQERVQERHRRELDAIEQETDERAIRRQRVDNSVNIESVRLTERRKQIGRRSR